MKPLVSTVIDSPDDSMEQHQLHDRVLVRLIAFSFASAQGPAYSFREAFYDFAGAYFALAAEDGMSFETTMFRERTVEALAQAFDEAAAVGQLPSFSVSTRLAATTVLTSLAALQRQVAAGTLTPTGATRLLVTVLFEGLQASPPSVPV